MDLLKRLLGIVAVLAVVGCGGGGSTNPKGPDGGDGGGDGGGTTVDTVAIQVRLIDPITGEGTTSIVPGAPVRAQAVLTLNGVAVANEVVQFSVAQSVELVTLDPSAGSQLTDANGSAVITASSAGGNSGAGRLIATATVGDETVSSSANFFASADATSTPSALRLTTPVITSSSVSAYGTTGVTVQVLQDGRPYTGSVVTVNFATSCPSGKATINSTATTQPDGTAVATFVDNGCAASSDRNVTITASIPTDTKAGAVLVKSPTTGSLRFVSVDPSDKSITLRGQGGSGRQENATITFKLVDVAGNGVADADVCFDATTYVGELNIDGFSPSKFPSTRGDVALCGSDQLSVVRYVKRTSADGTVSVQVNSGNTPTPVRVRARAVYPNGSAPPKETFSDTLSISTGLPLQRSFSLSIDSANIDGGNYDGVEATLTVRLADQFSNPVPDNTVVNFIASGGSVCSAENGSCRTSNGACSCVFRSQNYRPLDGRVVVTAYAVGLENYNDLNANNAYDVGVDEFTAGMDLGDAYVDANKDGRFGDGSAAGGSNPTVNGDTDIAVRFQDPSRFTRDGNGERGTAHIRSSTIVYLSRSSSTGDPTVVIPNADLWVDNDGGRFVRLTPNCPSGSPLPETTISTYLEDGIGNPMAAGTAIAAEDVSDNLAANAFRPGEVLAIGARPPQPLIDSNNIEKPLPWLPSDPRGVVTTRHSLTLKGVTDKCSGNARFIVQVDSPRGAPASARVLFEGEPRGVERFTVPVRYRNAGAEVTLTPTDPTTSSDVLLTVDDWTVAAPGGAVSSATVDWGDGQVEALPLPVSAGASASHRYAAVGTYTVKVSLTVAGLRYQTFRTVIVGAATP